VSGSEIVGLQWCKRVHHSLVSPSLLHAAGKSWGLALGGDSAHRLACVLQITGEPAQQRAEDQALRDGGCALRRAIADNVYAVAGLCGAAHKNKVVIHDEWRVGLLCGGLYVLCPLSFYVLCMSPVLLR
jgi:hypothetical protein